MRRDTKTELLLAAVVRNNLLFIELMQRFQGEVFVDEDYNLFLAQLREFYQAHKRCPTLDEFRVFVDADVWDSLLFVPDIYTMPATIETDVARDKLYQCYQERQTRTFITQLEHKVLLNQLDVAVAHKEMQELVRRTAKVNQAGIAVTADNIEELYLTARDYRLEGAGPLTFKNITSTIGGVAKGEIAIYIAPSSRGKTLTLINELYTAVLNGEQVLYVSMENKPESLTARFTDRVLLMTRGEQRKQESFCRKFLKKFHRFTKPYYWLYQPANSFTVADLDLWLDSYKASTGVAFDRVIVDYLNKFKKIQVTKGQASHDVERFLTDELRALAIAKNLRVITAAQTNRRGIRGEDGAATESVDETHLQGGFGQFETADIVLGYSETPAERKRGSGRIGILKIREGGGRGLEYVVTMAPWVGLITDCADELIPLERRHILDNPNKAAEQLQGLTATLTEEQLEKKAIPNRTRRPRGAA